ncbi:XRE family transcriptional regulator [bacterium]|jgi:transcriptional regulator|nr:XRE family transcriptional regulator [bacterium]
MTIDRLKEIREDRDLLQKDIAKILNIPQQNYSRYELGIIKMPIDKYVILAKFYNVSIDYLVGITDIKKPYERSILS